MAQSWFVQYPEKIVGPLTAKELARLAQNGQLTPDDKVSLDQNRWHRAALVQGLMFGPSETNPTTPKPILGETIDSAMDADSSSPDDCAGRVKPFTVGTEIMGYRILGVLGQGGMGMVYKAQQIQLERVVALKTIFVTAARQNQALARFKKEARVVGNLQHPNIVTAFDFGQMGDQVYFVMELLDGEDLDARIERTGRLDERITWGIIRQTAAGLAHAAEQNITHRDIKPANLFLVKPPLGMNLPPGVPLVKITDFGLALFDPAAAAANDRLTATGVVVGTPIYMAPEQFAGTDVDCRADIYALGATAVHALTGQPPFRGASVWDIMINKMDGSLPPLPANVSAETKDLAKQMLAKDCKDRIQSYSELIGRIDALPCMRTVSESVVPPTKPMPAVKPSTIDRTDVMEVLVEPTSPPLTAPSVKPALNRAWLFAAVGTVGLVAGVTSFVYFRSTGSTIPKTVAADEYKVGYSQALFNQKTLTEWIVLGGPFEVSQDDEGASVIQGGNGTLVREYPKVGDVYRVVLGIDLHTATAVELHFAIGPKAGAVQPRAVLRIAPGHGVRLGMRANAESKFEPLQEPLPVPPKGIRMYQELRFEYRNKEWLAFFDGKLMGKVPDDGPPKLREFRLVVEGEPIHIESAVVEELLPAR